MPLRSSHQRDQFPNITNWDDGYEYIRAEEPAAPGAHTSYYPPPSYNPSVARDPPRPPAGRSADPYPRPRYSSPVSAADTFSAPRRRRTETSPPRRSRRISPSPERRGREGRYPPQASQGRPAGRTATFPARSESTRERPRPRVYSRSPSPVRARRNRDDRPYMDYRRTESPPPRRSGGRTARAAYSPEPEPPRYTTRPRRAETYRPPSPPPATRGEQPRRPDLSRSNTAFNKARRFASLSPRWQKVATAALQAGGATAYSLRSDPGAWKGDKGLRVATAALGAGAFDAFNKAEKSEERSKSGGSSKKKGDMEALGGALGGLILEQIASRAGGGKKH